MNTDSQHLQQVSEEFQRMVEEFFLVQSRYSAAIKEIQTKLEILDDEFQMRHRRNPIHHMQSRLKTIQSMLEKLKRKNYEVSINSAVKNLQDIAGIRVICSYVQDVYTIANLLVSQDDVHLVRMADYIREPKPNGYRSLHLIVEIPVFLSEGRILVPSGLRWSIRSATRRRSTFRSTCPTNCSASRRTLHPLTSGCRRFTIRWTS